MINDRHQHRAQARRGNDSLSTTIHRALDLGFNLLDTRRWERPDDQSEAGRSQGSRATKTIWVVPTKFGRVLKSDPKGIVRNASDWRVEREEQRYHGCLCRLRVNVIDLFYLHRIDLGVPIEETDVVPAPDMDRQR